MLLLIYIPQILIQPLSEHSNTSYVAINRGHKESAEERAKIQIHRMLLLIVVKGRTSVDTKKHSNTSYVAINPYKITKGNAKEASFKYIVCCY